MSVNPRINITTINSIDTKTACFNRARYYDPSLERFLGEDPLKFNAGDINFYRYVKNSPVNLTDPLGLSYLDLDIDIRTDPNDPVPPYEKPKPKPPRDSCCDWYPGINGNESFGNIVDLEEKWFDCCNHRPILPVCE